MEWYFPCSRAAVCGFSSGFFSTPKKDNKVMIRNASAQWKSGLKDGSGTLATGSGALKDFPYSFTQRFENEAGTNPEELIGAAYASCYAMALSASAEKAGLKPTRVETKASVTFEKTDAGFTITGIHLEAVATIPGTNAADFAALAESTRTGCPIGRLLSSGTKLTVDAKLA